MVGTVAETLRLAGAALGVIFASGIAACGGNASGTDTVVVNCYSEPERRGGPLIDRE
jgi:hypothetical protein